MHSYKLTRRLSHCDKVKVCSEVLAGCRCPCLWPTVTQHTWEMHGDLAKRMKPDSQSLVLAVTCKQTVASDCHRPHQNLVSSAEKHCSQDPNKNNSCCCDA